MVRIDWSRIDWAAFGWRNAAIIAAFLVVLAIGWVRRKAAKKRRRAAWATHVKHTDSSQVGR